MAGKKKKRKPGRDAKIELRRLQKKERQLEVEREKLFALLPGGSAERPVELSTPAVISTRVGGFECPICGGVLKEEEQVIDKRGDTLLRRVDCKCKGCGKPRSLWFRIRETMAN